MMVFEVGMVGFEVVIEFVEVWVLVEGLGVDLGCFGVVGIMDFFGFVIGFG